MIKTTWNWGLSVKFKSQDELAKEIDKTGLFRRVSNNYWRELIHCEFCDDTHNLRSAVLKKTDGPMPAAISLISPVRLSDGINELQISFGTSCFNEPFRNLTNLLGSKLGMMPMTEYQVFDSMKHLYDSLRFTLPGYFYLWDGVESSDMENWAQDQGYLLKLHYLRSFDSPLVDLAIEIDQTRAINTQQFGLSAARYGTLMTFWGAEMQELDAAARAFEGALAGHAQLLNKLWAPTESPGPTA